MILTSCDFHQILHIVNKTSGKSTFDLFGLYPFHIPFCIQPMNVIPLDYPDYNSGTGVCVFVRQATLPPVLG